MQKKKKKTKKSNTRSIDRSNPPTPFTAQKPTNRILAHVRPGGGRSTADFNTLCQRITESWNRVLEIYPVDDKEEDKEEEEEEEGGLSYGEGEGERELRAIFVLGTIVAGREVGFELPAVSTKTGWLILGFVIVFWGVVFLGSLYGWI